MARFRRIKSAGKKEDRGGDAPSYDEINQKLQGSFSATIGGGLGDIVSDAVMSGFRVVISIFALVIVLWLLTFATS
jgi:hypothetical protein